MAGLGREEKSKTMGIERKAGVRRQNGMQLWFGEMAPSESVSESTSEYSVKIDPPVYEPKGDKPQEVELYDRSKTSRLQSQIARLDIPKEIKRFLHYAAERHTVFYFDQIAEYYAHAPADIQRLMEDSALVIIDFNKAIELGYVRLSEQVAEQYLQDWWDEDED